MVVASVVVGWISVAYLVDSNWSTVFLWFDFSHLTLANLVQLHTLTYTSSESLRDSIQRSKSRHFPAKKQFLDFSFGFLRLFPFASQKVQNRIDQQLWEEIQNQTATSVVLDFFESVDVDASEATSGE